MHLLEKYISILNWVEPIFTYQCLSYIKDNKNLVNLKFIGSLFKESQSSEHLVKLLDDIDSCINNGYKIICVLDENYPSDIKANLKIPSPLMYRGIFPSGNYNLALVGSRKPQHSSVDWLKGEFSSFLTNHEFKEINVFSGGAYGVDQLAHKISLLHSTPTTCFLPTGVNECYPKVLKPILSQIVEEGGALISPFSPNFPIYKSNFYYRNRILVLMSNLVFIIEARRRSGTSMTASLANRYGKEVVTLPQPPIVNCLGGLDLIEAGSPMIRCHQDLIFQLDQVSR